jgi:ubiquinone/menaquinone biosynthesis C-methylase UbiE/Arc/MetJ-type ribon-helix-helix transcriptional regulator
MKMHSGWRYDLAVGFFDRLLHRGKVRELRRRTTDLARFGPGERVLDVGCGTGTLAIEVQSRVGEAGRVCGVDPDRRQIARARRKAARRRLPIEFQSGVIERLDFPDAGFDVVLSTLMLHHLSPTVTRQGLAEIARVLVPGGRVVIADFGSGSRDLTALVSEAGFRHVETEEMPFPAVPGPGHQSGSMELLVAVRSPREQVGPIVERLDQMVAAGRVTGEEAERLREAVRSGGFDEAVRDVRIRHAEERLAAGLRDGTVTREEADTVLARVRNGEHPRLPRPLRHVRHDPH